MGIVNMLNHFKNKVKLITGSLTNLENHKIGKAVLTIVIFLDLFILMSIFQGLDSHVSQLVTQNEYIPQRCRDIVIDSEWNESNTLIQTANIMSGQRYSSIYRTKKVNIKEQHPVCAPISRLMLSIENNKTLVEQLGTFNSLRSQANEIKSKLDRVKGAYDTSLLEVISGQRANNENIESLKEQVSELTRNLNAMSTERAANISLLMQNENIRQLISVVKNISQQNKDVLIEDLRHFNFWFPLKRFGMEMIFLLPLIFIFYLWNSKSIAANRPYQKLVSSHLLIVAFVPVLFKMTDFIYEVIPKKLLKYIFDLLESLNLVAIWHYLMMGVGIVAALLLIRFMQQKIFSHENITQKRITKGQCQNCGSHMPLGNNACTVCGFKQFKQCSHCNKDTYVHGKYCRECGISE